VQDTDTSIHLPFYGELPLLCSPPKKLKERKKERKNAYLGEQQAIMRLKAEPPRPSMSNFVSLDSRYGTRAPFAPAESAEMTFPSMNKLRLMLAVSFNAPPVEQLSFRRSLPAKSTNTTCATCHADTSILNNNTHTILSLFCINKESFILATAGMRFSQHNMAACCRYDNTRRQINVCACLLLFVMLCLKHAPIGFF
jgi:hypothetical protein